MSDPNPRRGDGRQPGLSGVALAGVCLGLAVAGFVAAILAALVSRFVWRSGAVTIPWGLILGLLAAVALVFLARQEGRAAGFAAAAGWVIGLGVLLGKGPGGDFVIAADWIGEVFLYAGVALVVLTAAIALPKGVRR